MHTINVGSCPALSSAAMTELNSWSVVLGSLQREGLSPGAEEVAVTALQLPRAYNHYSQGSDLALLRLAHPVVPTPLCLPQPAHRFPFGTSCWATGWDQDTNDGKCCFELKYREAVWPALPNCSCPESLLPFFASSQDPTESTPASYQSPHMQLSLQPTTPAAIGQPSSAWDAVWRCPARDSGTLSGQSGMGKRSRRGRVLDWAGWRAEWEGICPTLLPDSRETLGAP